MGRNLPTVHGDVVVGAATGSALVVGTAEWYTWLEHASAFAFVDAAGTLTARKQRPSQKYRTAYWYAFRKAHGTLHKVYLGRSADLSRACLVDAAAALATRTGAAQPAREPIVNAASLSVPPARTNLVVRERLYTRLDAAFHTPLTVISAPVGYGKTTLVAGWLPRHTATHQVAWATFDRADHTVAGILHILVAALQIALPHVGATTLALLQSVLPPQRDLLLSTLLADLQAVETPCMLVLDDYQYIQAHDAQETIGWLVDRLPQRLHLVIITREASPLPLARLRANNHLIELGTSDLRFLPEETSQFLHGTMRLPLDPGEVALLETRTQGWIAGLQLAALAVREQPDHAAAIAAFGGSHRFVAEYLVEQVLEYLPPQVVAFVLQTSILDRMCDALCAAVMDQQSGKFAKQTPLKNIEQLNLFLVPLDEQRTWYRYHPLFADAARQRLRQIRDETAIAALHGRASIWWQQHDAPGEAIRHALAARAFSRAASLIEALPHDQTLRDQAQVEGWLALLPQEIWQHRPRLWLARAMMLFASASYAAIEACLAQAEHALGHTQTDTARVRGEIAALRALMRSVQDDPGAVAAIRDALATLGGYHPLRAVLAAGLGYAAFGVGDLPTARRALTDALALLPPSRHVLTDRLTLLALLAMVAWGEGRLRDVEQLCQTVVQQADHGGTLVPVTGTILALLFSGVLLAERNDLHAANCHLARCVDMAHQTQQIALAATGQMYLALVLLAQGERAQARRALAEVAAYPEALVPPNSRKEIEGCRALFWLRDGDLAAASRWAAAASERIAAPEPLTAYDYPRIALARTLIAQGNAAKAAVLLGHFAADARATGHRRLLIWALALLALAQNGQGQRHDALATLEQALGLALPEGYLRLFVDEGAPMLALLREAQSHSAYLDYVRHILDVAAPASVSPPQPAALAEPLTPRERDVLHLIAAGASNGAIAEQLVVSVGTVKKYAHSLFGKLDVHSRTQAIVRGRELGLL